MRRVAAWAVMAVAACAPAPRPVIVPPPEPPAPTPVVPAKPVVPSEGSIDAGAAGFLYYHIVGSGPDTVIVPLGVLLDSALAPLGRSHTLVFYDPRHRGRSTTYTDSTLSTFSGDVDDLERVRAQFGLSKMALVGFSYYAAVVAMYAASHPDRVTRLALLSPIEPTDSLARLRNARDAAARIDTVQARRLVRMRAAGADTTDVPAYCRAFWALNAPVFVGDTSHARRVRADFCQMPNEGVRAFAAHIARVMASLATTRDLRPTAARVPRPVLVIHGDRDLVANPQGARAWAGAFPEARVLTIRGGGHFVFVDDPDGVQRALAEFFDQGWPAGAASVR